MRKLLLWLDNTWTGAITGATVVTIAGIAASWEIWGWL